MTTKREGERRQLVDRLEKLNATARLEDRPLTEAERAEFDSINQSLDRMKQDDEFKLGSSLYGEANSRATGAATCSNVALAPSDSVREYAYDRGWLASPKESGPPLGEIARAMIFGPRDDHERRALSEGTDSAGGYTVPTILAAQWIDLIRAQSVTNRLGMRTVVAESDVHDLAKLSGDITLSWRAENSAIAETTATFDRMRFTAKSVGAIVRMSRELLQDSRNVGEILQTSFTQQFALEIDRCMLSYTSTDTNRPSVLIGSTGINVTSATTTTGVTVTDWSWLNGAHRRLLDNNVEPNGAVMHPTIFAKHQTLNSSGDGQPLQQNFLTRDLQLEYTSVLRTGLTVAGSTDSDGYEFHVGNFEDLYFSPRLELRLETLRERYADSGQVALLAFARFDGNLGHTESFEIVRGLST